jgi:hypothetical protein
MNRRGFLKFLGLAGASTAAAASGVKLPKTAEEKWVDSAVADLEAGLSSHNEKWKERAVFREIGGNNLDTEFSKSISKIWLEEFEKARTAL